jgi:hypothetical protein
MERSRQLSAVSRQEERRWSSVIGRWPNPWHKLENPVIRALRSHSAENDSHNRISFYSSTKKLRLLAGAVQLFLMADG